MDPIRAWYLAVFERQDCLIASLVHALEQKGIELTLVAGSKLTGPGIVFFDEPTPRLHSLLREIAQGRPQRILAIGASAEDPDGCIAWGLLQAGASDVLCWDAMDDPASAVAGRLQRWQSIDAVVASKLVQSHLVGQSRVWISVLREVVEVGTFTKASVLLEGETGTGKELIARLIHSLDSRKSKTELILVDCTTTVPELSGSEFFGHERGAFTGAATARDGAFALADRGTLFLDEIGELPLSLQGQLMRAIQEGTYKRVGGNVWHRSEFRLVSATNRDLTEEVRRGNFRRDLYYRIATARIKLPPLSERTEDIVPLAQHFIKQSTGSTKPPDLDAPVRSYLLTREYPGNVRELKQLVDRMMHVYTGPGPITAGCIPESERPLGPFGGPDWCDAAVEKALLRAVVQGVGLKEIRRVVSETAIGIALRNEEDNLHRAASKLGVTSRALQIRRSVGRQRDQIDRFQGTS